MLSNISQRNIPDSIRNWTYKLLLFQPTTFNLCVKNEVELGSRIAQILPSIFISLSHCMKCEHKNLSIQDYVSQLLFNFYIYSWWACGEKFSPSFPPSLSSLLCLLPSSLPPFLPSFVPSFFIFFWRKTQLAFFFNWKMLCKLKIKPTFGFPLISKLEFLVNFF